MAKNDRCPLVDVHVRSSQHEKLLRIVRTLALWGVVRTFYNLLTHFQAAFHELDDEWCPRHCFIVCELDEHVKLRCPTDCQVRLKMCIIAHIFSRTWQMVGQRNFMSLIAWNYDMGMGAIHHQAIDLFNVQTVTCLNGLVELPSVLLLFVLPYQRK